MIMHLYEASLTTAVWPLPFPVSPDITSSKALRTAVRLQQPLMGPASPPDKPIKVSLKDNLFFIHIGLYSQTLCTASEMENGPLTSLLRTKLEQHKLPYSPGSMN